MEITCSGRFDNKLGQDVFPYSGDFGNPLLYLHGSGCDSEDWCETIRALPPGLHIVTMDFRGHGESDDPEDAFTLGDLADDVLLMVEHLNSNGAILIGHSLGGMVALATACRCPKIGGIVLLEGRTGVSSAAAFDDDHHFGGLDGIEIRRI